MRSYTDELIPPQVLATPIPAGADFGIRVLARVIDFLFGLVLGLISGFVGGIVLVILSAMGRVPENWVELVSEPTFSTYAFGIVGALLYHFFSEGIGGTSLGKLLCGLNVVQFDGSPCTIVGAFKRSLLYYIDGILFGWVAFESMRKSPLRQRHGDHWGKTVVVKKSIFLPTPKPATWRVVVGFLVGASVWMAAQIAPLFVAVSWYDPAG